MFNKYLLDTMGFSECYARGGPYALIANYE